jgi:hypothetical protein
VRRGQVALADRKQSAGLASARFTGYEGYDVSFALEGCTGWRYVVEELVENVQVAGIATHLAAGLHSGLRGRSGTPRSTIRTSGTCEYICWPATCPSAGTAEHVLEGTESHFTRRNSTPQEDRQG